MLPKTEFSIDKSLARNDVKTVDVSGTSITPAIITMDCNTEGPLYYRYFGIEQRQYRDPSVDTGISLVFKDNVTLGIAMGPKGFRRVSVRLVLENLESDTVTVVATVLNDSFD